MRTARRRTPLVALALAAIAAAPGAAQDVQYKQVTKLDLGTGANVVLKIAGASEFTETISIKGTKMRSDMDKQSTIWDPAGNRFIMLDHERKTYTSATMEQMTAVAGAMMTNAKVEPDQARVTGTAVGEKGDKIDYDAKLKFEPTSERQNINGAPSERNFMTMETDLKYTAEGETKAEDAGTIVLFVDTWVSTSGPAQAALQAFNQAAGEQMVKNMARSGVRFESAFATNPGMGEAMRKAMEEQKSMQGLPMRSTFHGVVVAPGVPFDREQVLAAEKGGGAGNAAKSAARGMIGGLLGGRKQQEEQKEEPKQQAQVMKMIMEVRDVQQKSLPESLFEIPAGYSEVPLGGTGN
jgi:hypothetical protein